MGIQIKKQFRGYPFAHRQPNHDGHCKFIHGHNWDFEIVLTAEDLDDNGFVYDFGRFGWLKQMLADWFDHTLVLNENDPILDSSQIGLLEHFSEIHVVPDCSSEGLARYVFDQLEFEIDNRTDGRVKVLSVTVYEDHKNSATYRNEAIDG